MKLKGGEVLATDLVVDASGRSSQTADWMAAAGLQPPPKLMVDAKLVRGRGGGTAVVLRGAAKRVLHACRNEAGLSS